MKLTICDDEKRIRDMIGKAAREVSENLELEYFSDAEEILAPDFDTDILFLDIQMPGENGMDAARQLRKSGKKMVIVFVTALEEEVFHAFDVGAFQYIVKPFGKERIKEVLQKTIAQAGELRNMEKLLSRAGDEKRTILVKSGGISVRVVLSEILYAEIFDRKIVLHLVNLDQLEYYGRISDLEKLVGNDFFRVHRAYLINLAFVQSYDSKRVKVSGTEIPVARGKYQGLVKACLSYHARSVGL